ncbi:hypothetical protein B0H15DRAFT_244263 [Mycena belliarum]|uniref:F-box domain-containing protein n=1 Tax=Mycena belliarum TaxID=1033014 RepID=A0AAD6U618_9AGAR|nr:hypothetical protein B0H15DRAFT_244263 [Mycena belliae]
MQSASQQKSGAAAGSNYDLRRLVFVCRYFRDICQPFLFEHQSLYTPTVQELVDVPGFNQHDWMEIARNIHRSTIRLKKLAGSPHASSVRSWHVEGDLNYSSLSERNLRVINIGVVTDTYAKMNRTFGSMLGAQKNIRSLRLQGLTIDAAFREGLGSLARLEEVELVYCDITAPEGPILSLRAFTLEQWPGPWKGHCDHPLKLLSAASLRTLSLDNSSNSMALLAALLEEPSAFPNLATLSVMLTDDVLASFLAFLERCPVLTELHILHSFRFSPIRTRVAPTTLPLLTTFTGPRWLASAFIADRPVSTLRLSDHQSYLRPEDQDARVRDLEKLVHAESAVRSFSIIAPMEVAVQLSATITSLFPHLRDLTLALDQHPPVFLAPTAEHPDEDDYEDSDEDYQSDTLDTDTIDLSDSDSLDSRHSGRQYASLPPSPPFSIAPAVPEIRLPGYMYTREGRVIPPVSVTALPVSFIPKPRITSSLIDCICADLVRLPPSLVSLKFGRPAAWLGRPRGTEITEEDVHRAILALTRQLPLLCELEFEIYGSAWTRRADTWIQRYVK